MTERIRDHYKVTFDRIGRSTGKPPEPIYADAWDADELAEALFFKTNGMLHSRDVDVSVNLEDMTAIIFAGMHVAGTGTIEKLP